MVWIILFTIIIILSFFLAFRSMRTFEDIPPQIYYGLFLVRQPDEFNLDILKKICQLAKEKKWIISFEKLVKGEEQALIIYGPTALSSLFPDLGLLELEDYVRPEHISGWVAVPAHPQQSREVKGQIDLNLPNLDSEQQVFLQIVSVPQAGQEVKFDSSIRIVVVEKDPSLRVALAKKINQLFIQGAGLKRQSAGQSMQALYEAFKNRAFVSDESLRVVLGGEAFIGLLKGRTAHP